MVSPLSRTTHAHAASTTAAAAIVVVVVVVVVIIHIAVVAEAPKIASHSGGERNVRFAEQSERLGTEADATVAVIVIVIVVAVAVAVVVVSSSGDCCRHRCRRF
jgi:ABC-type Fe3+ transport system permease subunit